MNFTPFIVVIVTLMTANLGNVSAKNRHCIAVWYYAFQCEGFGYPTTHDGLGSLPSAFIERVARKLGEKGRSADSAILPFLCYTFVPKCRINGDVSNIRPCRDACDKLEGVIGDAISDAAGGVMKGRVCEALSLVNKGEGRCVSYRKLKRYGEANQGWKRKTLNKSQRNATNFEHLLLSHTLQSTTVVSATTQEQKITTSRTTTSSAPTTYTTPSSTSTPEQIATTQRPNVFKINGVVTSVEDLIASGVDIESLLGDAFGSLGSAFNAD